MCKLREEKARFSFADSKLQCLCRLQISDMCPTPVNIDAVLSGDHNVNITHIPPDGLL